MGARTWIRPLDLHDEATLEPIVKRIAGSRIVLLGEATHGTQEFYVTRAALTRRLIEDHGFRAVVVEADWPDAYRVNRYVRGHGEDASADAALGDFERFPTWMWRNTAVRDFVDWLHARNAQAPVGERAGFYGMDLYSLHRSMEKVIEYLEAVDVAAAERARRRYACFDHFGREPQRYGQALRLGLARDCEQEVLSQWLELCSRATEPSDPDERFFAEQNAQLVKNAERYYRAMFEADSTAWNLRDTHMAQTIRALDEHLGRSFGREARLVVWAHNSHLGDARFTERSELGEINVGQLLREAYGLDCTLVGFTTHHGTVAAASGWGRHPEHKRVRAALGGSWERALHELGEEVGHAHFAVTPDDDSAHHLSGLRLQRAIGVVYRPETERFSHYFEAELARQFDIVIHHDESRAIEPLDAPLTVLRGELPETYPFGL